MILVFVVNRILAEPLWKPVDKCAKLSPRIAPGMRGPRAVVHVQRVYRDLAQLRLVFLAHFQLVSLQITESEKLIAARVALNGAYIDSPGT